ncbi:hypothetical protein [Marinomonas foliarum]|uniref:Uncharacterized protein n=1 Tax=Marinomonas foliarum TaxID=491950 RepID=A0A369AEE2_9GAMM|nr:hypothetical protein [Marinomonas foliarum]RCX07720.1 hypothetical protein DFP77_10481 [Marinomonas foliarum]
MFAIVIFGSQVSGGNDDKSDHDLLIVCEAGNKRSLIEKYSKIGYSVSAYTPKQLELMQKKGSLFIQHLKFESKILFDKDGEFKRFIECCSFIKPKTKEINQSRDSILNAIQSPQDRILLGWKADYLFVLSRDYFVKYLARNNDLVFNTKRLSVEISKKFNLSIDEINTFLRLREHKSNYRNGEVNQQIVARDVDEWVSILSKVLALKGWGLHKRDRYINCLDYHDFKSTYDLLRYVESLRILFPEITLSSDTEKRIHKIITRPNHYSSTSVSSKSFLNNYLLEFRARANKSKHADLLKLSPFLFQKSRQLQQAGV